MKVRLPVSVLLAGTCGESSWRRDLKQKIDVDIVYGTTTAEGDTVHDKKNINPFPAPYNIRICCVTPIVPLSRNILAMYEFLQAHIKCPLSLDFFTYLKTDTSVKEFVYVMKDSYEETIANISRMLNLSGIHTIPGAPYEIGLYQIKTIVTKIICPLSPLSI